MPAKSKHMERRKQRIANAKKNARLAGKMRRRRRLQATLGLLVIAALLTLGYLWQSGFFDEEEPVDPATDVPPTEMTGLPTEEAPAEGDQEPPADEPTE
ncbi:hypothetical protein [Glycomyces xiaoerkulensis]|uniref:hypothetical protein n=1 Tax=Glycomyces xiaoerkulensis TaxID=2038139 RepID=UPI000C26A4F9|nr:hypothetical protein [Glycomyces xiaoerkulensis]